MGQEGGSQSGGTAKGVGYYKVCFWNEKKTNMRLMELMDAKDKTIAFLKQKLGTKEKEDDNAK